jgi:predicted nucleic acid-binding protein
MTTYLFLDQGALTLSCKGKNNTKAVKCREWIGKLQAKGYRVVVPEIADYEARRAFICSEQWDWLGELDALSNSMFLPLSRRAMLKAAELWAYLKKSGLSVAPDNSLDADCILAAQAITAGQPGDRIIIATTNEKHLNRFPGVEARPLLYLDDD